jgi:magnesium-transporting ATPase (P-type)
MTETRLAVSNGVGKMSDEMNQILIDSMNVPQNRVENRAYLDSLKDESGYKGVDLITHMFGLSPTTGLTANQVLEHRAKFGTNEMPASPKTSYFMLLFKALSDTTLLILIAAACVSFGIGYWEDPKIGWIEGTAIFIAVFLVSNISAGNDYSKELQFRALESSSQQDQRASVLRDGQVELINPSELVVGDICVLQVDVDYTEYVLNAVSTNHRFFPSDWRHDHG